MKVWLVWEAWPFGTGTLCVPGSNGHAPHQGGTYNCMALPDETVNATHSFHRFPASRSACTWEMSLGLNFQTAAKTVHCCIPLPSESIPPKANYARVSLLKS